MSLLLPRMARGSWAHSIAATGASRKSLAYSVFTWPLETSVACGGMLVCAATDSSASSAGTMESTAQSSRTSSVAGSPRNARLPAKIGSLGVPIASLNERALFKTPCRTAHWSTEEKSAVEVKSRAQGRVVVVLEADSEQALSRPEQRQKFKSFELFSRNSSQFYV